MEVTLVHYLCGNLFQKSGLTNSPTVSLFRPLSDGGGGGGEFMQRKAIEAIKLFINGRVILESILAEYADKMHDLSERWAGGLFGYQSDMWLNCLAR